MESNPAQEWLAISVRQPWAELLVTGQKSIEIRSWATDYRGRMWLHAGLKRDPELEHRFGFKALYTGGFIGSIKLVALVPMTRDRWMQWRDRHLDPGEFRNGLIAWIVDRPRRFPMPVPSKGQLGLFNPPDEVIQQLKAADSTARSSPF